MADRYDYLIVGAGFFGAICAYELTRQGKRCVVLDKRGHIGGNCFTEKRNGINLHCYGPHIFHTSNKEVWDWINQFVSFNHFRLSPVAFYRGEIYSLPFNMWTFNKLWGVVSPEEAERVIREQSISIGEPLNLEEQAIKLVGVEVYEKLIKGYTAKQWMKDPKELPKEIVRRLPVRFTYDSNYFNDTWQGIPVGGYTQIFEKLLRDVPVFLNTDYLQERDYWNSIAKKVIYTGPIDQFFDYVCGALEYKTTRFDHEFLECENYQGVALMNFTDSQVPYTRIIEHKHFEFLTCPGTWITREYPTPFEPKKSEPLYPVNDSSNNARYQRYREIASSHSQVYFGGRLGEYKYYDMHQVIESALSFCREFNTTQP